MKPKKVLLVLFILGAVGFSPNGLIKTARAEGLSQTLMEKIKNWAYNALGSEEEKNIDNSRIRTSYELTTQFWGKKGGYGEMTNLDKWLIHLSEHEDCKIEGSPDGGDKNSEWYYSYGPFCYKAPTWIEKIHDIRDSGIDILPNSTDEELLNWVGDWDLSFRVTKWIVINQRQWSIKKGWFTSINYKIGEPPK